MSHNCNTRYAKLHFGNTNFYADSSRKRYWRAHGDTTIFNFNYGSNNHCCGGHKSLGFWGGLGMGFGSAAFGLLNSFGNWFGGGFGGFGGFGNFGFGGGFGNFGGGFGNFGMPSWNNSWNVNNSNNTNNNKKAGKAKDAETEVKVETKEVIKENADVKNLDELDKKLEALLDKQNKGTLTQDDIDNLQKEIQNLDDTKFDGIQDDSDKARKERLIKFLPKLNDTVEKNINDILEKDAVTDKDINTLIINFDTLQDEQKTALIAKLEEDLKGQKNSDGSYKVARDYSTLKKMELLCKLNPKLVVNIEHYAQADDSWIKGSIKNVEKDNNGNISYWVDCADTGDRIKASWMFKTGENSNTAKIVGTKATDETCEEYNAKIGMSYEWDDSQKCYINKNNKPTAQ